VMCATGSNSERLCMIRLRLAAVIPATNTDADNARLLFDAR